MSFTGIKTLPLLTGTVASSSPWAGLFARSGFRVYPFQLGAKVRSTSTGTAVTLSGEGAATTNDYVIFCDSTAYGGANMYVPNLNKIRRITAVSSADDAVTIDSAVSITAGDYMLVIGADTASTPETAPNYDGSTISLYSDNTGVTAVSPKYLATTTGGLFIGWVGAGTRAVDLLVTNSSGVPQIVMPFVATLPNEEVNQVRTYTAAGTTPSAAGFKVLKVGQSGGVTITNFTGGTAGQKLTVIFTDSNTTISSGTNFALNSSVTSAANMVLELVYDGTKWYEVARSTGGGASATIYAETELVPWTAVTGSSVANIDMTSISQLYDDLILRIQARTERASTSDNIAIYFNNDTTATNYFSQLLHGTGTTAASEQGDVAVIIQCCGTNSTAGDFGTAEIVIPNYTSATAHKQCRSHYGYRLDASNSKVGVGTVNWEVAAAAISRITLITTTSSNISVGTRYQLVGRKSTSV